MSPEQRETRHAYAIALAWEEHALRIRDEGRIRHASNDFRSRWPALVRWRDAVLKAPRRNKPAHVAAAYELLALECTLANQHELAAKAQREALRVMRVPMVHPINPIPGEHDAPAAQSA